MRGLGVVTGLESEAACLPTDGLGLVGLFRAGGSARRAHEGALALADRGAGALLSFGIAGGLDPKLAAGDLVVSDIVIDPRGRRYEADTAWRRRLAALPIAINEASIAGSDHLVDSVAAKRTLHVATGAAAVDMESHGVAAAALARDLPFLAIRAVGDPAGRAMPWCAHAGLSADGQVQALPVIGRLCLRPWELPALVALWRDSARALESLRELTAAAAARGRLLGAP